MKLLAFVIVPLTLSSSRLHPVVVTQSKRDDALQCGHCFCPSMRNCSGTCRQVLRVPIITTLLFAMSKSAAIDRCFSPRS